jgi:hypothetical protein
VRRGEESKGKRDFIVTKKVSDGAEVSLRRQTVSHERRGKKKSACSVRNGGGRECREEGKKKIQ